MHNKSNPDSACKMPQVGNSSRTTCVVSTTSYSTPKISATNTFSQPDRVQHRLHCQVSDCLQCRCDSGYYNMTSKCWPASSSLPRRTNLQLCCKYGFINSNNHFHNNAICAPQCQQRSSLCSKIMSHRHAHRTSSVLSPSSTYSPANESHECPCCEHSQYCCRVYTSNTSICSDHVKPETSVSTSHVCSCICKTLKSQPETNIVSTSVLETTSNSTHHHTRWNYCWNFLQRVISSFSGLDRSFLCNLSSFIFLI